MLKVAILTVIFLFTVVNATDGILTMPLGHMRLKPEQSQKFYQFRTHHLRHFSAQNGTQTYPLHSLKTIFTLSLNVNGFDYNLSVDTGSSDFFIKGEDLLGKPQQKFSCKRCITENYNIKIGYLDGKLSTYLYNSTVKLGYHTFNQNILVAYYCNNIRNFLSIGGIVGLSFQQIARNPYPNFINTLIKEKIISKYRFGLKLNFKDPQTSFITFGGIDHQYIDSQSQLRYYDITGQRFHYNIETSKVYFGEKQLSLNSALLDSGNTCVSISAEYTDQMLEQLNVGGNQCQFQVQKGNNMFKLLVCNISDFQSLPVITIVMPDGNHFSWQKQYYLDSCYLISQQQQQHPLYRCNTLIENVQHKSQGLFLGAAWMLKYYTVFDLDSKQIGMAKNSDNPTIQSIINRYNRKVQHKQINERLQFIPEI